VGGVLQFGRHLRPAPLDAWSDIAAAVFVPPAIAAPAETPQRQHIGIQAPDRDERGFALHDLLLVR
jgi:hypothetical protein